MRVIKHIKHLSFLAILGLAVACAPPQTEEPVATTTEEVSGAQQAEAQAAIDAAQARVDYGNQLGADMWQAENFLGQAQAAFNDGNYDQAIDLANSAKFFADQYILAKQAELVAAGNQAEEAPVPSASAGSTYEVVSGDSLWSISGSSAGYGDPFQWPLIYKANKSQIEDADLIFPGQVFEIISANTFEIEAAIQHAKTRGAWTVGDVEASDEAYLAQ